jgi:hypothetical protein
LAWLVNVAIPIFFAKSVAL